MKKETSLQEVEEKIRMIRRETKIRICGFFIIGYPGETGKDLQATLDFASRLPLHRANFFNFTPFPGSPEYDDLKKNGLLDGIHPDDLYIHSIAFSPPGISKDALRRFQIRAHLRFYLRPLPFLTAITEIRSFRQVSVIARRVMAILKGCW